MCDEDDVIFHQLALEAYICGQNLSTFSLLLNFLFTLDGSVLWSGFSVLSMTFLQFQV